MAQPHAKPGHIVDLRPLGSQLRGAKTTALIKEKHFEAIRLIVHEGAEIPPHAVSGNIMLHCLEGQVILGLPSGEIILEDGGWIYLNGGDVHSLKGIVDSSLLLTILLRD
ncbi:MAG: cupin [Alphaproteobacteria bacterium 64-11]|nr:cupin [Alphaproteobacteria bacterium]OJU08864.1 MAG: cupin [Alphaproteobacteria bacterium 64-11]